MDARSRSAETERERKRRAWSELERRRRKERRHGRLSEVFDGEMIAWTFVERKALKL